MAAMIDLDALIEDLRASARMAEEDCIALGEDDVESAAYHHGVGAGLMKAVAEIERRRS
jgi:hypothetical protein